MAVVYMWCWVLRKGTSESASDVNGWAACRGASRQCQLELLCDYPSEHIIRHSNYDVYVKPHVKIDR
jgi:hypothetical protein